MESLGGVLSLAGGGGPSSTPSAPVAPVPFKDLQLANFGHPGNEAPFWHTCGGVSMLIWQKIAVPGPAPTPEPEKPGASVSGNQAAATDFVLATQVIAPPMTVGVDPAGFGITGLASYFSLGGYDATPIIRTVAGVDPATDQPASIVLRATLRAFVWDFGDGSTLTTTSLGTPYPGVSDISHVYDIRSDRSPLAVHGAYSVKVRAVFDVDYQAAAPEAGLNHTGWVSFASLGLPPITSGAEHDHKVVEVRSILTSGPGA